MQHLTGAISDVDISDGFIIGCNSDCSFDFYHRGFKFEVQRLT